MFSALLQRRSPSPRRSGFVPALASPLEIVPREGPSTTSVRPPFPPRRPLRHQRRQAMAIQIPPPIMTSPPTSPSYNHGPLSPLPKTPINTYSLPSSPPGAPLRCRIDYPSRLTDDGESSSTCVPDKIDLLLSESAVGGGSDAGGSTTSSIGSLLDAAFRRSTDRMHAEFLNLRTLCTKILLTGKQVPREQMDGINLDLLVPGGMFDDLDDDDEEPLHDAPMDFEDCNSASPATTYYSLSPSSSPIRYDIDLPAEPAAASRPSPLPLSSHPRPGSSSSPPVLLLNLPDPFTNDNTFEPLRTKKRKRTDSTVPRESTIAKRQRLRTTRTFLSAEDAEDAAEEAEVEAELLELQPPEDADFDVTYNRTRGRVHRAPVEWLLHQSRLVHPPIRVVDSVFLD
ncbi:hypothetical protein PLEOSDRAFT_1108209 [Pleurotus ostreatus PC15]|uniref:Uncharacterized protein n=1 Tax=Pleurotus ostreatus (strain PC15) TaxID=1137138 RepID=A0A067N795_PLEO1|nr:hypothetical protein PLEOSDRAFT_1108209 [Pleurotus ostreatus PC15]